MERILRAALLVAAAWFAWIGVQHAGLLGRLLVPASSYETTAGSVLLVEAERDEQPGQDERPGFSRWPYQVKFRYGVDGRCYQAQTLSPLCESCEADEVQRVTGQAPLQLAPRTPLRVYVMRGQPQVAYLTLGSGRQTAYQAWMTLLFLVIVPAGLVLASRAELSAD